MTSPSPVCDNVNKQKNVLGGSCIQFTVNFKVKLKSSASQWLKIEQTQYQFAYIETTYFNRLRLIMTVIYMNQKYHNIFDLTYYLSKTNTNKQIYMTK